MELFGQEGQQDAIELSGRCTQHAQHSIAMHRYLSPRLQFIDTRIWVTHRVVAFEQSVAVQSHTVKNLWWYSHTWYTSTEVA